MCSPGQRTHEGAKDVFRLDPRSVGHGTWFLHKSTRGLARVDADSQKDKGDHTEHTRGHLGHEGSQDLGGWVFSLPVGVFGHVQCEGSFLGDGSAGRSLGDRGGEGSAGSDNHGKNNETKLGHFDDI